MSKGKVPKNPPVDPTSRLTVKVELEDWILVQGSAQALTQLANQILMVATEVTTHLTLDHPGPYLADDSNYGLIVLKTPNPARGE